MPNIIFNISLYFTDITTRILPLTGMKPRRAALGGTTRQKFQAPGTRDNFFNTARHTFSQINSIAALILTMYGHVKSWHSYTVIETFCNDYNID